MVVAEEARISKPADERKFAGPAPGGLRENLARTPVPRVESSKAPENRFRPGG